MGIASYYLEKPVEVISIRQI